MDAVRIVLAGAGVTEVAAVVGVSRQSVHTWISSTGYVVPAELRRLENIIHGYENQRQKVCAGLDRCAYDDGAFGRIADRSQTLPATSTTFQCGDTPRPPQWPG
jgi:hypothetical protein